MWEIFYLGFAVPYGDKKEFEEVVNFLHEGNRLNKPPLSPTYIYDLGNQLLKFIVAWHGICFMIH